MDYRVDFEAIPWKSSMAGSRYRAFESGGKRLRVVEYADYFKDPHWCSRGHVGYVLEGKIEIDFDGDVITYGPGDGIFIPPGGEHRHKAKPLTEIVKVVLVEDI